MAHSGKLWNDGLQDENYSQGSKVPPPPSYDDAVRMGMESLNTSEKSGEHSRESEPVALSATTEVRPMSSISIEVYKTSWMHPYLKRVKMIFEKVSEEIESAPKSSPQLAHIRLENKDITLLKVLAVEGEAAMDGPVGQEMAIFKALSSNFQQYYKLRRYVNEDIIMKSFHTILDTLRDWICEEERLDREWTNEKQVRVPHLESDSAKELDWKLYDLEGVIDNIYKIRRNEGLQIRLEDHAADVMVKIYMQLMWKYFSRIAEFELQKSEAMNAPSVVPSAPSEDGAPAWRPPPAPPLSSVCDFQDNRLYQLLLKVKDMIDKTCKTIVEVKQHAGADILSMTKEMLQELKAEALTKIMDSAFEVVEEPTKPVDSGESWFYTSASLPTENKVDVERKLQKVQVKFNKDLVKLITWIKPQEKLDAEWTSCEDRIPTLTTPEKVEMGKTLMTLQNRRVDLSFGYGNPYTEGGTPIYASELVVKETMESLWSLLTRIAAAELKK